MPTPSPLAQIEELKAQITKLQGEALAELEAKRARLAEELAAVEAQIQELTGAPARRARRAPESGRKVVSFEQLTELLKKLPGHTLNIRKEGYDVAAIKALVAAHPGALRLSKNGPWPAVTLL
jgi:predicted  nucleic acid-binding Zn-ribbon protein